LLTIRDVQRITTLSKSSIYRLILANKFPDSVAVSSHRRAWRSAEIQAFIESPLAWGCDP